MSDMSSVTARLNANLSIANDSNFHNVPFDAATDWVVGSDISHSPSINPERFTINTPGSYLVSYVVTNAASVTATDCKVVLYSGSDSDIAQSVYNNISASNDSNNPITFAVTLTAGDYVRLQVKSIGVSGDLDKNATSFFITKLDAQTGPQGDKGPQGVDGATGPIGTGLQGAIGPQGIVGAIGHQGNVGVQGPDGLRGIQGLVGLTGVQGQIGFQGSVGTTGTKGFQGYTGDGGADGIDGFQGPEGPMGENFGVTTVTVNYLQPVVAGIIRITVNDTTIGGFVNGQTVYVGIDATSWQGYYQISNVVSSTQLDLRNLGYFSSPGNTIYSGNYVVIGAYLGAQGFIGYQGFTGPTGPYGGPIGSQGPQGNVGVQGAFGGPIGPQGNDGVQGLNGPQGFAGSVGSAGARGLQGIYGPTGPQGGPIGPQGDVGPTGDTGARGLRGFQGFDGAIGPVGSQGVDGGTSAAGSGTEIQFNTGGNLDASSNLTFDPSSYCFSAGYTNIANGLAAIAEGYGCTSSGTASISLGEYCNAGSNNSVTIGCNLIASAAKAHVYGSGISGSELNNAIAGSIMFVSNSNLASLTILQGSGVGTFGNIGIHTNTPAYDLDINGVLRVQGAFGANNATPQTPYSVGSAVSGMASGSYTSTEQTILNDVVSLANNLRAALINNGIAV